MFVPFLVLGVPFWDVCIDGGKVGAAEIKRRGYQTCSYLVDLDEEVISTVVWCRDELDALIEILDDLYDRFAAEVARKGT